MVKTVRDNWQSWIEIKLKTQRNLIKIIMRIDKEDRCTHETKKQLHNSMTNN
jgi:hypothetical protein